MDEQSIEPARAQAAPGEPIDEAPPNTPSYQDSREPARFGQPTVPVADLPSSPWAPTAPTADQEPVAPPNPWQLSIPVVSPPTWQPGTPTAALPQSPWQPAESPSTSGQVAPMQPATDWLPQLTWPDPGPWHPPLKADAGLPPGWHAPLRTDLIPPPQPRKRRGKRILLTAAAVVVLLVAGVTTWLVWPPDRSPFEQAVASLAAQPVVNYRADLPDSSQWDGRVTAPGDAVGGLTVEGERFPFMILNGKLYVKLDSGLFPPGADLQLPGGAQLPVDQLKNRWVTGSLGLLGPLIKQEVTPSGIADKLRAEVAATPKLPTPSDDGTTINNVPVLKADTPNGTLYVAKNQPYRVVRWIDKDTKKSEAAFTKPGRKLQLNGARAGYSGLGIVDFTPVNADVVDQTYDEMETNVGQLGDALDGSVHLTFDTIDQISDLKACANGPGCTLTAHFTGAPTDAHASVPNEVTAQMTAQVLLNDIDAGSCTTTGKVSSHGSGTLGCTVTNMAGAYAQASDKAKTEAEAKAGGSPYIFWYVEAKVLVFALPLASVDLVAEGRRLESLRPDHACGWTAQGGSKRDPILLQQGDFTARYDTGRYPDFEIHVFRDGQAYGDFGPSGWFAKNGGSAPSDVPRDLDDELKIFAVTFMKASGTLKDGDDTSGDKWKRPAPHC